MGDVLGRRIAAAIIDAFIIAVLLVVIAKTLGDEGTTKQSLWAETEGSPRTIFLLLTFAYYFGTELAWAQTVGKRVMKLRVVRADGGKLSAGPAAIRNLVRFVDALPALYIVGGDHGLRDRRAPRSGSATWPPRRRSSPTTARRRPRRPRAPDRTDRPDDDDILAQVLR